MSCRYARVAQAGYGSTAQDVSMSYVVPDGCLPDAINPLHSFDRVSYATVTPYSPLAVYVTPARLPPAPWIPSLPRDAASITPPSAHTGRIEYLWTSLMLPNSATWAFFYREIIVFEYELGTYLKK